jgi:hypothetical protein
MGIVNNVLAGASGNQGYFIQRSLRFRSSASAYLNRTPASAGNRQTWTWSGWVKRGLLGGTTLDYTLFRAGTGTTDTTDFSFSANANGDVLYFRNRVAGVNQFSVQTTQSFRDVGGWYHIVVAFDSTQATASNRLLFYVNGTQVTSFSVATYGAQNSNSYVNATNVHYICAQTGLTSYFDGYLAEVNFIDGQALTPSSFGQTDAVTGVWVPKKYTGTYGTNGFYLNFSDNTSATTLAYDKSGNGNNWTANNISTTAGATYDSMTDVPTLTSATAANFCVMNPLDKLDGSISGGNLDVTTGTVGGSNCRGSIVMTSGKWYWEFTPTNNGGIADLGISVYPGSDVKQGTVYSYQADSGNKYSSGGGAASYGSTYTTNDVIGIAYDATNGKIWWAKNGTWQASGDPAAGTNAAYSGITGDAYAYITDRNVLQTCVVSANFGQRPFSYTPPTGFKALNTFNLPDPTIKKPNQYMDVSTWSGNSSTQTITNSGFQPDLLWGKCRNLSNWHGLLDSVRGVSNVLWSNATNAEASSSALTSFNSNGFTLGSDTSQVILNTTGSNYVGWQWKESATAGFDIVTYTGTGSTQTIAHSLGVTPKMMIAKQRNAVTAWRVWHQSAGNGSLFLNGTNAFMSGQWASDWNSTNPTSSVFSVGSDLSGTGGTLVAYLFAEIPGFSKFGSYTGNGSADGPFVFTNFQPKYVLIKRTDTTGNWYVWDTTRNTYNVVSAELYPNLSNAEATNADLDANSNGFKIRNTTADFNANGGSYIYAAFSTFPFKYSTAR